MRTTNEYLQHVLDAANRVIEYIAARGMRNLLAHGYFDVDLKTVWNTAKVDIPKIKETVTAILGQPEPNNQN